MKKNIILVLLAIFFILISTSSCNILKDNCDCPSFSLEKNKNIN